VEGAAVGLHAEPEHLVTEVQPCDGSYGAVEDLHLRTQTRQHRLEEQPRERLVWRLGERVGQRDGVPKGPDPRTPGPSSGELIELAPPHPFVVQGEVERTDKRVWAKHHGEIRQGAP
jgi:hypothetical protein